MLVSLPATDNAFQKLIAALEAEVTELNSIGTKVAFHGDARNARKTMDLAGERAKLRDHIVFLYKQWKQDEPVGIRDLQVEVPGQVETPVTTRSPLSPRVAGMSVKEAAQKLCVDPAKIVSWLEEGKLTGFRRVSGRWKILQKDLVEFSRVHRNLL
jgi:hypothetical protein